ncbi:MAG: nucleoside recognition domain-containing protein [Pseudomonadota bacterium]|nr:nucleoside recognition domain-containing protein [Pseudomonadota bacterium]
MQKIIELQKNILEITYELFRIMIPTLIIVKVLQELGFVGILNNFLSPLMFLVGLPEEIGIVFTTTMLTSPYTGLAILSSITLDNGLSTAQASVLGLLMLFTHSLPIEALICRRAGVRVRATILVRLIIGFSLCVILSQFLLITNLLNSQASILIPFSEPSPIILDWILNQVKTLLIIFVIIIFIVLLMEILKYLGIQRMIELLLKPFLNLIGVGEKASTIAVVGVTLGIGFGGGLLIQEVKSGRIKYKDVFGVITLIGMLHSIVEDTGLVSLMGANIFITLFLRFFLTLFCVYIILRVFSDYPEEFWKKHLVNDNIP